MNEIVPGLYLGSWEAAYESADLRKAGITHILTAMGLGLIKLDAKRLEGFKTLQLPIHDVATFNIIRYLPQSVEFVDYALSGGGKVLVHCYAGVSRSATVVAAYLMAKRGMTPHEALTHMREKRPCVSPNTGFLRQLTVFHRAGCVYVEQEDTPVGSAQDLVHEIGNAQANRIRCRKCRRMLATRQALEPHHGAGIVAEVAAQPSEAAGESAAKVAATEAAVDAALVVGVTNASEALASTDALSSELLPKESAPLSPKPLPTTATSRPSDAAIQPVESTPLSQPPIFKSQTPRFTEPPSAPTPLIKPSCSGYFLDPQSVPWLQAQTEEAAGEIEGKITCPNDGCGAKLGNWSWVGVRCACNEWIVPGFCLARAKVDQTR